MQTSDEAFKRLSKSKFRSSFHLSQSDIDYVKLKGTEEIRRHCESFICERLAPAFPKNDGKQTPMKGHPVFVAQHACACCCRGCLYKWYKVKKGVPLTKEQSEKIVNFLMKWIEAEVNGQALL